MHLEQVFNCLDTGLSQTEKKGAYAPFLRGICVLAQLVGEHQRVDITAHLVERTQLSNELCN